MDIRCITNQKKWRALKSISKIEATRTIGDKETPETRFYISSTAAVVKKVAWAVRSHWRIENSLHWVLDVTFGEDDSRIRRKKAPENIAIVRHVALNLLRNFRASLKKSLV